jgi:hypothetical protein
LPQIDQTNWHWHLLVSYGIILIVLCVSKKNIFGIPGFKKLKKKNEPGEQLPDLGFSHGLALLDPFRAILRMQGLCTAPYQGQTVGHVEGVALGDLEPKGGTA